MQNQKTIPITTSSTWAAGYFRIGRDLYERLRELESRQYFLEAVNLDSNFALAYLYLTWAGPGTEDHQQFRAKANSLVNHVSEGEKLLIQASAAFAAGDVGRERDCYHRLVELYPLDERAHNGLGNQYLHNQDYLPAVAEYQKAIELNPEFSQAYNGLGYALSGLRRYPDAEQAFQNYITLIPDDPNPYDSYAELLLRMGRLPEALANYQKALRLNHLFFMSYEGMASAYNYLGQYHEAREVLADMQGRAHDVHHQQDAYFALAVSYADEGNVDSALAQLRHCRDLAEQCGDSACMATAINQIGDVWLNYGRDSLAEESYRRAAAVLANATLDSRMKESAAATYIYHAAHVALRRGDTAAATSYAQQYHACTGMKNNPDQQKSWHELLGAIAMVKRDYETATNELSRADADKPANLLMLARAYHKLGNLEKAHLWENRFATFHADNDLEHALLRGRASADPVLSSIDELTQNQRSSTK